MRRQLRLLARDVALVAALAAVGVAAVWLFGFPRLSTEKAGPPPGESR